MKAELQDKLFKEFDYMFRNRKLSEIQSCMARGICVSDGWYDLLFNLCTDIQSEVNKHNILKEFSIEQVKEKLGKLRVYVFDANMEIYNLIEKAQDESGHVCEVCGQKGSLIEDDGWLSVRCKGCEGKGV